MATTSTPAWTSNRDTLTADPSGTLASGDANQYLGSHAGNLIYQGASVLTPDGSGVTFWARDFATQDLDQPFTMSGTTIGRVVLPLLPVGQGADLLVSLCADNAGVPGTIIQQTRVPASWTSQLAAVYGLPGPPSSSPVLQYTGSPLALAQSNCFFSGSSSSSPWSAPAGPDGTVVSLFLPAQSTNYLVLCGGVASGSSAAVSNVFTIAIDGNGNFGNPIPQPSMPTVNAGTGGAVIQTDPTSGQQTLLVIGGTNSPVGTTAPTNLVYAAAFNPLTGSVSSWSAQASLNTAVQDQAVVAYGQYVYSIVGLSSSQAIGTRTNIVQYAQVQNGQISTWNTTTPFPLATTLPYQACVIGNYIFAAPGGGPANWWYSIINGDGTLGQWIPVPNNFTLTQTPVPLGSYGICVGGALGNATIGVSPSGPDVFWQKQGIATNGAIALGSGNVGQWQFYSLNTAFTASVSFPVYLTPHISVPLPATGLSNGTTYHILMQQQGGDLTDYLRTTHDFDAFPGNPTFLSSPRGTNSWTATTAGNAVPIQIFDQTVTGPVWHTWEDSGARISTIIRSTTPDQQAVGLCESTLQPSPPLNQSWNFSNGLGQWAATGGAVTSSTAQLYAQLSESALLTPTGAASQSYILSGDFVPVAQGHTYTFAPVVYSPTGYASCSANILWYNAANTLVGTTSGTVGAVAAGTWTTITVSGVPTGTAPVSARIQVMESATPPATALLYTAVAAITDNLGTPQASVTQITYANSWPTPAGPPLSVVQLA